MKIKKWLKKDDGLILKKVGPETYIENNSSIEKKVYSPQIFRVRNKYININFQGEVLDGTGATLTFLNRKKKKICTVGLNSVSSTAFLIGGVLLPVIVIKPNTKIKVKSLEIQISEEPKCTYNQFLGQGDILVITPLYPSQDNLCACGFVHSRVKSYTQNGLHVDVAMINDFTESSHYTVEGIDVYKTNYKYLRDILMAKTYKAIFVHFYDSKYAYYLDTSYLNDTPIFIWNHGADILSSDAKDIYTPYFSDEFTISKSLKQEYKIRNKYIKKHALDEKYNWIFVSNWEQKRAEELHDTKFHNAIVIPNIIDSNIFKYHKKNKEKRKKIFLIRRFDNYKKYAIDTAVLAILELSRRSIFNDLEFYICGEGSVHDILVEPLLPFSNVHILNNFMTHKEIAALQEECGIGLFPTRWDTQGVSALEAASAGLVVISTDIPVIREYFDEKMKMLCPINDYISIADKIEYLYNNPTEFISLSQKMAQNVQSICSYDKTIKKEIEYYEANKLNPEKLIGKIKDLPTTPLLTIIIPSYKAEKFLDKCLLSILKSQYKELLEVLLINDGSTDRTPEIGEYYEQLTTKKNKSIVKLINKENGGHGSGINKGIELAQGKYLRVIDADDWIDTIEFDKYMKILMNADVDLLLNDYCEARTFESKPFKKRYYSFMNANIKYVFNDVCQNNGYGFPEWGPTLPTTTYKTKVLRETNFKLLEKTFYVDMLYNAYSIILSDSIMKVDADIYRYYIGNIGQSVSKAGMMKNYKHHEDVIIELTKLVTNDDRISAVKKDYILRKLLLPMIDTQYYIIIDLFHSGKIFRSFEKRIKQYPEILHYEVFHKRRVKIYRLTKGLLVGMHPFLHKLSDTIHQKNRRN